VFEHFSARNGTPVVLLRLNYAIALRYGVLLDIGQKVFVRQPVSLAMGAVNVIWQGDANSVVLRSLALAATPPFVLNLTGPETLRVRHSGALRRAARRRTCVRGAEAETALLNDASLCTRLMGLPQLSADRMIEMTANWIRAGGSVLGKPTHFEVRDGKY